MFPNICEGLNNRISGIRELPWGYEKYREAIFRMTLYIRIYYSLSKKNHPRNSRTN